MNSLLTKHSFVGNNNIVQLNCTFWEFFSLAREIRTELKEKSNLLDEYLLQLFRGAYNVTRCEAVEDGAESIFTLSYMCAPKIENFRLAVHPCFGDVKQYIDQNPLPFCNGLEDAVYVLLLSGEYLKEATERYEKSIEDKFDKVFDTEQMLGLLSEINRILGTKRKMKRLNLLFKKRFLTVCSTAMFLQGATNQLLDFLTMQGGEKSAFQVLLEQDKF